MHISKYMVCLNAMEKSKFVFDRVLRKGLWSCDILIGLNKSCESPEYSRKRVIVNAKTTKQKYLAFLRKG